MKRMILMAAIISASLSGANLALADASSILTNAQGMTLYTFDKDSVNASNCYDLCAEKWPPYTVGNQNHNKAGWGKITRKDGSEQWTFNDRPLYTWVGDTQAGDTNGDGLGGLWHTAKKTVNISKQTSYDYGYY